MRLGVRIGCFFNSLSEWVDGLTGKGAGFIQMQLRFNRARWWVHSFAPVKLASQIRHEEGIKQVNVTPLLEEEWYVTSAMLDIVRL
jgi:hypothetical protein